MNNFKLNVTGLNEVAAKIKGVEREAAGVIGKALQMGVLYIHQNLPPYPSQKPGKMVFVSERQRRYFFYALKKGLIETPYRRTMTLGRSFTTFSGEGALSKVSSTQTSFRAVIGTSIPYAQYVVGDKDKQARIHQDRWFVLVDEIAKHVPKVTEFLQAAIDRLLRG